MKPRILAVAVFLIATALIVRNVGHGQPIELKQPFSLFPDLLSGWSSTSHYFSDEIEQKLGVSDYFSKTYRNRQNQPVELYVGYYESQKHGGMIHSPKNCLPGNGWYISKKGRAILDIPSLVLLHDPLALMFKPGFPVNKFIVENGTHKQMVIYWYQQSGGRVVTNEYLGRVFLVLDAFTANRTDTALIRVTIPVDQSVQESYETGIQFLKGAYPKLMEFLPHRKPAHSP